MMRSGKWDFAGRLDDCVLFTVHRSFLLLVFDPLRSNHGGLVDGHKTMSDFKNDFSYRLKFIASISSWHASTYHLKPCAQAVVTFKDKMRGGGLYELEIRPPILPFSGMSFLETLRSGCVVQLLQDSLSDQGNRKTE